MFSKRREVCCICLELDLPESIVELAWAQKVPAHTALGQNAAQRKLEWD